MAKIVVMDDEASVRNVIQIARLVHLARYLPALIPEDF